MDYTRSDSFVTHALTGQRMHKQQQAVPTAVDEKDINSVLWSLMEVVKAGGHTGVQFDENVPSTYSVLLRAINKLIATASSDGPGRVSIFLQPDPPPKHMRLNGALLSRAVYPELWQHVAAVGAVSDADWYANRWGWFSSGDGSTTFRIPMVGGESLRFLDGGRGVDVGRLIGSWQAGGNEPHTHGVNQSPHAHGVIDTMHAHSGSTSMAGSHNHGNSRLPEQVADTDRGVGNASAFSLDNLVALPADGTHSHTFTTNASSSGIGIQPENANVTLLWQGGEARPRNVAWPVYLKYEW